MNELEGQKRYGKAEHFIATVSPQFYDLTDEDLRAKVIEVLRFCGVVGGCLIYHGARWNKARRVWYCSPHFHVLGVIVATSVEVVRRNVSRVAVSSTIYSFGLLRSMDVL
jgi:hypothetical protein